MKRVIIFSFIVLIISTQSFAQDGEKLFLRVKYSVTGQEYLDKNKRFNDLYNLDIGQNASMFFSHTEFLRDSVKKDLQKKGYYGLEVMESLNEQGYRQGQKDVTISNRSKNQYINYTIIGARLFTAKEPIEKIDWKILKDTAIIFQYKCIKATTNYKGREWVVWFAPEIHLNIGPWKFHGLPGLILKAEDSENHYMFECVDILKIDRDINLSRWSESREVPKDEFVKMLMKFKTNPIDFTTNQAGISGKVRIFQKDGTPVPNSKYQNYKYNPIEL